MEKVLPVKFNFHLVAAYIGIKRVHHFDLCIALYLIAKFADCLYAAQKTCCCFAAVNQMERMCASEVMV